jgi:hypothetical protein
MIREEEKEDDGMISFSQLVDLIKYFKIDLNTID